MTAEKNGSAIPVTFVFPAAAGAQRVALSGDFNQWSRDAHPMILQADDSFSITIELAVGRRYQYRYLVDDQEWENDWSADAYVPNEYGGNNSQLDLSEHSPRVAAATIAPRTDEPAKPAKSARHAKPASTAKPSEGVVSS